MFRSMTVYQLTQATDAVLRRLDGALQSKPYAPPLPKQAKSLGFVNPLNDDTDDLTYRTNGGTLFCLRMDEKKVPPSAIREQVDALRAEKEAAGEEFNKTEERIAKEEITERHLPNTLAASKRVYAYVDDQLHMLFVGAGEDDADEFTKALRGAFGIEAPTTDAEKKSPALLKLLGVNDVDPCDRFTAWLRDTDLLGEEFDLGHVCSLKHAKEGGCAIFNIRNEELESDEIDTLLAAGKECCSISLEHEEMDFRLTSKLGIRNIKLGEDIRAQTFDEDEGKVTAPYEFAAFVPVMRNIIRLLEPLLGEWPKQELLDLDDMQTGEAAEASA